MNQNLGGLDISSVTDAGNFLLSVTMSTANWSNTLIGWEAQGTSGAATFHGGFSQRNAAGTTAKDAMNGRGYTIIDGGAE